MRPRRSRSGRGRFRLLIAALVVLAIPAWAAGPVLHTYFEADPAEDLAFSATTPDGRLPAAIETPSGTVPAPDTMRQPSPNEPAYGGSSTPASVDATYRIDRNTTRPEMVGYDDPFIPSVTPFKRLYAYDAVEPSLELGVADKSLVRVQVGGSVRTGDDQFYADMTVDLVEDTAVRIPSVGPGTRILTAFTTPATAFQILKDGADNWFIRSGERKRVQLIMQLAIAREVFGSPFSREVSWTALSRHVPPLPQEVRGAAERAAARIGVSRNTTPAVAATTLVAYFRSFAPSDDLPTAKGGVPLFEELTASKKGVCRHRAFAFVITAHGLGLPARMVRNEAHAWVELYDGNVWHRVDLGGAADRLDTRQDPSSPQHAPPSDPYAWPEGAERESGRELADRTSSGQSGQRTGQTGTRDGADGGPSSVDGGSSFTPTPSSTLGSVDGGLSPPPADDERPASKVEVKMSAGQVRRGEPLAVSGRVEADGDGCRGVRVDFALRADSGRLVPIQSLSAGEDGRFDGAIVVPHNLEVGEYELVVSTPGDTRCGIGTNQ